MGNVNTVFRFPGFRIQQVLLLGDRFVIDRRGIGHHFFQPLPGQGAFPRLVSVPLGLLSLYLILRPGMNQRWPGRAALIRQLCLLVLLMVYAGLIHPLGFLPTALLTVTLMIRLFGATWRQALPFGLLLTLGLYLLFEFALGMPLPDMPGLDG